MLHRLLELEFEDAVNEIEQAGQRLDRLHHTRMAMPEADYLLARQIETEELAKAKKRLSALRDFESRAMPQDSQPARLRFACE